MLERLQSARAGDGYRRWERRTDGALLWASLVFLLAFLVPVLLPVTAGQERALDVLSWVLWVVFVADYATRLYLSPGRPEFVRTHLLDLLVIAVPALRPLRAVRLLGLVRGVSLLGLVHQRAGRPLHARVGLYVCAATAVVIVVLAGVMYDAEKDADGANITSIGDAAWWAITTVTTVGYGDRYPTTTAGRLVAVMLMLVGIALLGVVTASVAAWFVSRLQAVREADERAEATMTDVLHELQALRATVDRLTRAEDRDGDPVQVVERRRP